MSKRWVAHGPAGLLLLPWKELQSTISFDWLGNQRQDDVYFALAESGPVLPLSKIS